MVKRFSVFILLFLILISCKSNIKWHSTTLLYFDTLCEINLKCSPEEFSKSIEYIKEIFARIENTFSPEKQDFKSPLFKELLKKSYEVYIASDGAFDVTIGPLSEIWGFQNKKYRIPGPKEINEALKKVGFKKILKENAEFFYPSWIKFDWGGSAKGFGVDLAYKKLKELGIKNGFINAGGDIYCWGKNPENGLWRIGIKHPRKSGFIGVIVETNIGIATSGDYQRFFEVNGVRYHHILNPFTGYPARGKQSVTVIGPETVYCDALATALFVSSNEREILKKFPQYGAIIVDSEGKLSILGKRYRFYPID
ncbi:FAD:protein FMN transferase [SCandidatus Aminicenantes bacterium Aminicenantia_JdfR_composite]|nr:FAD:protein FMN transferase [SCandidatus Aminicenantes bacterium Aminicenantia_JdfR_composite]